MTPRWVLAVLLPCCAAWSQPPAGMTTSPALKRLQRCALQGRARVSMSSQSPPDADPIGRKAFLSLVGGALASSLLPAVAAADEPREIGEIPASGLIFKDTIKITSFKDPKVKGVELYITDFERPITDRLQKNFFSDPTQASIACARTGPIEFAADLKKGKEGEEVFEQARSLLFKSLRVRRVYDEETNTLVYVSYSTRLNKDDDDNKSRYKSTTCAIHVDP